MPQDLLRDRVKCAVPNPGAVAVGSTITLGAAPTGFRSWLTAFPGGGLPAYFILSDGAGRALTGVWTINATNPETATITEILGNDRLGNAAGETFAGACVAWCEVPAVEVPVLRSGPLAGLRNLVINGNPTINQRGYVSGAATTGANQYTLDRWRVPTSGQALSWTDSAGIRTVTFPAGGGETVIEGASIQAGVYTLGYTGTAAALVNGAAVANGGQVTLPGNTDAVLRFSGGTASKIQLEPGPLKTPFEFRPIGVELALCMRYFWACGDQYNVAGYGPNASVMYHNISFPTKFRAIPTGSITYSGGVSALPGAARILATGAEINFQNTAGTGIYSLVVTYAWFSAEL